MENENEKNSVRFFNYELDVVKLFFIKNENNERKK